MSSTSRLQNLRPLTTLDVLDVAFRLYRGNFWLLIKIFATLYLPINIVLAFVSALAIGSFDKNPDMAVDVQILQLPLHLVNFGLVLIATGALTKAVSATYLGEEASLASCYAFILPKAWRLLGAMCLFYLLILFGFLLCLVPGILFAIWYMFVTPIIVLENLPPVAAFSRSKRLVSGYFWKVAGTTFLASVIQNAAAAVLMGPSFAVIAVVGMLRGSGENLSTSLIAGLTLQNVAVQLLLYPFLGIVVTLLYYDLRIRKEGLDLQLMAREVGYSDFAAPPQDRPQQAIG